MAGGSSERWGNYLGLPKHLVPIDGEALLHRTVRLLRANGIEDILVVGPFEICGVKSARLIGYPEAVDGRLATACFWNPSGQTIVLMGDAYYSDEATRTIVGHSERDHHLFARFTPSHLTGKPWPEIFANSFWPEHHAAHEGSLSAVHAMLEQGELERAGLWEAYLLDHGRLHDGIDAATGSVCNCGDATEIDDWTEDFDYPEDYDRWMAAYRAWRGE